MIEFKADPLGFSLGFKGRNVLRHGMKITCMAVGSGEGRIVTSHDMYHVRGENGVVWINAKAFKVILALPDSFVIEFIRLGMLDVRVEDGRLVLRFSASDLQINRLRIDLETDPEEIVYGCGEQFSRTDLRWRRFPLWVSEPGISRGTNYVRMLAGLHSGRGGSITITYFPQPAFVTSGNLYCHVVASSYALFDFRSYSKPELMFWQIPDAVILGVENSQVDAMDGFTRLIGRLPALPDWAYEGIWLGVQGGRAVVEAKLEKALAAGIRVTALWCQDWQGIRMTPYGKQLYWNWEYDNNLYPDLPASIESLQERGIRFLGYNNPFLATDTPQYAEAAMKGFLVKSGDGNKYRTSTTSFPVSMLDLSNPDAREWIKGIITKHMMGIGLDGWMADFGEYLPADGLLASGGDPFLEHNRYPVEEAGKKGQVLFFVVPVILGRPEKRNCSGLETSLLIICRTLACLLLLRQVFRSGNRCMNKSDTQILTVLLPEEDRVHLWSGQYHGGGKIRIRAPYGEPPVFWRKKVRICSAV